MTSFDYWIYAAICLLLSWGTLVLCSEVEGEFTCLFLFTCSLGLFLLTGNFLYLSYLVW